MTPTIYHNGVFMRCPNPDCMTDNIPSAKFCKKCGSPLPSSPSPPVPPVATGNTCSICGEVNPSIATFCRKCGNLLANSCPTCGKQLQFENAEICPNCGVRIKSPILSVPRERNVSKSSKSLIIGLVVFVGIMIFAVVVYSDVMLGAVYFTHEKSPATVPTAADSSTTTIQMIGNVYGLASNPSAGIDEIRFTTGLAPDTSSVDLSQLRIVFSTPGTSPVIYTQGKTASTNTFTTKLNGVSAVNLLTEDDQVDIDFKVVSVAPNTMMTVELKPIRGASLSFSRTAPIAISPTNILY
jgi:flagellin FlaB